jgi:hypothetical protein
LDFFPAHIVAALTTKGNTFGYEKLKDILPAIASKHGFHR